MNAPRAETFVAFSRETYAVSRATRRRAAESPRRLADCADDNNAYRTEIRTRGRWPSTESFRDQARKILLQLRQSVPLKTKSGFWPQDRHSRCTRNISGRRKALMRS
jgi:hypothetical protein